MKAGQLRRQFGSNRGGAGHHGMLTCGSRGVTLGAQAAIISLSLLALRAFSLLAALRCCKARREKIQPGFLLGGAAMIILWIKGC